MRYFFIFFIFKDMDVWTFLSIWLFSQVYAVSSSHMHKLV